MRSVVNIDVSEFVNLEKIVNTIPEKISRITAEVVIDVSDRYVERAVKDAHSNVTLGEGYIRDRISILPVKQVGTKIFVAIRSRDRATKLSTYGYGTLSTPNEWTYSRFVSKFGKKKVRPSKKAPYMGWTNRKGDVQRGIAIGRKAAGIEFGYHRGARKTIHGRAFALRLRNGNGMGIFIRNKSGKLEHKYGPSVTQLLVQDWKTQGYVEVGAELKRQVSKEFKSRIGDILK